MCKMMSKPDFCGWSVKTVDKVLKNKKVDFFNEFESYLINNKETKLLKKIKINF